MEKVELDNGRIQLYLGDCLEIMPLLPPNSIDMVLVDLPYGATACKWDSILPFDVLWNDYKRLIKDNSAIVLTASEPFTSLLIASNLDMYKYSWIWKKSKGANFTHAKNMPIKFHEDIPVFSKASIGHEVQLGSKRMKYFPQDLVKVNKVWKRPKKYGSEHGLDRESHKLERIIEFEGYPTSVIDIGNSDNRERGLHPTQKPVALMEYLIKTYTNEWDLVLDNTMGSGTTGVACIRTNRRFIGIEKEEKYFKIAVERCKEAIDILK